MHRFDPNCGLVVPCVEPTGLYRWDPFSQMLRRSCDGGPGFNPVTLYWQALMFQQPEFDGSAILDHGPKTGDTRPQQPGRAFLFDGVDDEVIAAAVAMSGAMTVSFRVKASFSTLTSSDGLVCNSVDNDNRFTILTSAGSLFVTFELAGTDFVCSKPEPADDVWVHVLATFDGAEVRLYYDLIDQGTGGSAAGAHDTNGELVLGNRSTNFFPGHLFDVRIYSKVLTAAERLRSYVRAIRN